VAALPMAGLSSGGVVEAAQPMAGSSPDGLAATALPAAGLVAAGSVVAGRTVAGLPVPEWFVVSGASPNPPGTDPPWGDLSILGLSALNLVGDWPASSVPESRPVAAFGAVACGSSVWSGLTLACAGAGGRSRSADREVGGDAEGRGCSVVMTLPVPARQRPARSRRRAMSAVCPSTPPGVSTTAGAPAARIASTTNSGSILPLPRLSCRSWPESNAPFESFA